MDHRSDDHMLQVLEVYPAAQGPVALRRRLEPLSQGDVLALTRQLTARLVRDILEAATAQQAALVEGVPIPVNPRRLCAWMAHYLSMN